MNLSQVLPRSTWGTTRRSPALSGREPSMRIALKCFGSFRKNSKPPSRKSRVRRSFAERLEMTDCCFCTDSRLGAARLDARVCWSDDTFYATPSLGPLGDEHLLLVTREHMPSFGCLGLSNARRAEKLIKQLGRIAPSPGQEFLLFEHGLAADSNSGGCGISHAHIHLLGVPCDLDLDVLPEPDSQYGWIEAPSSGYLLSCPSGNSYLLVGFRGKYRVREAPLVPSQFLRQWLAGVTGQAAWDWRADEGDLLNQRAQRMRARCGRTTVVTA
jgi:diadenosine tetraphosphate (Ap4A) HIT family hydrolase